MKELPINGDMIGFHLQNEIPRIPNKEAKSMYYTVLKLDGYLRLLLKIDFLSALKHLECFYG